MTLLVRDEEDIVAANIAYTFRAASTTSAIVTDNRSVDGTREILEEFARTGRVTVIDERGDDFSQFLWVTRMARVAAEMGADWVINNDADEIWWVPKGDLKTCLETVPPECGSLIVPYAAMRFHCASLTVMRWNAQWVFHEIESVTAIGQPLREGDSSRDKRRRGGTRKPRGAIAFRLARQ